MLQKVYSKIIVKQAIETAIFGSIVSIFEIISIMAIGPLVYVLLNPPTISNNQRILTIFHITKQVGIDDDIKFTLAIFIVFCILVLLAIALKMIAQYKLNITLGNATYDVCQRLARAHIAAIDENKHSADITKKIMADSGAISQTVLGSVYNLITGSVTLIVVVAAVLLYTPTTGVSAIVFMAVIIYFVNRKLSPVIRKLGVKHMNANAARFKTLAEILHVIHDVRTYSAEEFFERRFGKASKDFCDINSITNTSRQVPSAIVESLIIVTLLATVVTAYLVAENLNIADLQEPLPAAAAFLVAIFRIKPALAVMLNGLTALKQNLPLFQELRSAIEVKTRGDKPVRRLDNSHKYTIIIRDIYYKYPNSENMIIEGANISIKRGEMVAIIGKSGEGKSTLLKIMTGTVTPIKGTVEWGKIDEKIEGAERNIAFLTQEPQIIDDDVVANIAFGKDSNEIDLGKIKIVLKQVALDDHFLEERGKIIREPLGENGVRLSGGQRQRLMLARALYADREIIVLDEPTSALDKINQTEIIRSIKAFNKAGKTIIVSTHNQQILSECDAVYEIKNGQITAVNESIENQLLK